MELKRLTTYREYMLRWMEGMPNVSARVHQRIEERAAIIAAKMQPGDELWEWEEGDWNRLAATSGLAIVRKIMLDHGGDVRVAEAPSPLGGARFIVTLPVVHAAGSPPSAPPRATPGVRRASQ